MQLQHFVRIKVHQLVFLLYKRELSCQLVLVIGYLVLTSLRCFDFDAVLEFCLFNPLLTPFNQLFSFSKHLLGAQFLSFDFVANLLLLRFLFVNLLQQLVKLQLQISILFIAHIDHHLLLLNLLSERFVFLHIDQLCELLSLLDGISSLAEILGV